MTKVLFRVDAGQILHVATGHAFRCMALASELAEDGADVVFLMKEDERGNALVRSRGWRVELLADTVHVQNQILSFQPDLVVFDLLNPQRDEMTSLRNEGVPVVVVHDLGGIEIEADLVVNGNIRTATHQFGGLWQKALFGPRFVVLGQDFDDRQHAQENPELTNILVTLGGADPMGFTPLVVDLLVQNEIAQSITVVRGPGFGSQSDLKNLETSMKTQVRVQENVPDLSMLMMAADLVVSAGGRTAYELAATGTPCVLVPTAAHEVDATAALEAAGAAFAVSTADERGIRGELVALVKKAVDSNTRHEMARAGQDLIDGLGRKRVAEAILSLCHSRAGNRLGEI